MRPTPLARVPVLALGLALSLVTPAPAALAQDATPAGETAMPGTMAPPEVPPGAELVVDGLDNPRGLAFGPDGALYVAEAGAQGDGPCIDGPEGNRECYGTTSAITVVRDGQAERLVEGVRSRAGEFDGRNATGIHDLAFGNDGMLYAVVGLGAAPDVRAEIEAGGAAQLGRLLRIDPASGEVAEVADISGHEQSANPDGGALDSNPYGIAVLPGGDVAVADAGGNFVARVTPDDQISTMAVFPDTMLQLPDGSAEIPSNAVPNAVAVGLQGDLYAGQLTGFPFPAGGASVWLVDPAGGAPTRFAEGFTNIIDLNWALDGSLYVLEFTRGGMLRIDPVDPTTLEGRLVRIAPDGTRTDIASAGLIAPTGLAIGSDGWIYVSEFGTMPDAGRVVRFPMPVDVAAAPAG